MRRCGLVPFASYIRLRSATLPRFSAATARLSSFFLGEERVLLPRTSRADLPRFSWTARECVLVSLLVHASGERSGRTRSSRRLFVVEPVA